MKLSSQHHHLVLRPETEKPVKQQTGVSSMERSCQIQGTTYCVYGALSVLYVCTYAVYVQKGKRQDATASGLWEDGRMVDECVGGISQERIVGSTVCDCKKDGFGGWYTRVGMQYLDKPDR